MDLPVAPGLDATDPCDVNMVRTVVQQLETLDTDTASYLNALALILMRVADADRQIAAPERRRMETILVENALLTPAQAVLVVEIARHRARLADCGCSYGESCWLRDRLDAERRQRLLDSLYAVAAADGGTSSTEEDEILQIAVELGFTREETRTRTARPSGDA